MINWVKNNIHPTQDGMYLICTSYGIPSVANYSTKLNIFYKDEIILQDVAYWAAIDNLPYIK